MAPHYVRETHVVEPAYHETHVVHEPAYTAQVVEPTYESPIIQWEDSRGAYHMRMGGVPVVR